MWAYGATNVTIEREDEEEHKLLTVNQKYYPLEARKICNQYKKWYEDKHGKETKRDHLKLTFQFYCFSCKKPATPVVILDYDEKTATTAHFRCLENNCYGNGEGGTATGNHSVVTDKSEAPVTVLTFFSEDNSNTNTITTTETSHTESTPREERSSSKSIARLCEQYYDYRQKGLLREFRFEVSYVWSSPVSYQSAFSNLNYPPINKNKRSRIYMGQPNAYLECTDGYIVVLAKPLKTTSTNWKPTFVLLDKNETSKEIVSRMASKHIFFAFGKLEENPTDFELTPFNPFWCHTLSIPSEDTEVLFRQAKNRSDLYSYRSTRTEILLNLRERLTNYQPKSYSEAPLAPWTVGPEIADPETAESESIEPESIEPESIEPESIEPESIEPMAVEPVTAEPESVEPAIEVNTTPSHLEALDSLYDKIDLTPETKVNKDQGFYRKIKGFFKQLFND